MSQYATELCVLIVGHFFGGLSSRLLATLFLIGRLSFTTLLQTTLLAPLQLKHSLSVLIQENLVLWYTSDDGSTFYEAHQDNCYNLVRAGKYLDIVKSRLQEPALSIVSHLITDGPTSIGLITQTCKSEQDLRTTKQHLRNGFKSKQADNCQTSFSEDSVQDALCDLLGSGLVQTVHEANFRPYADNRLEAEKLGPARDELATKVKAQVAKEYDKKALQLLDEWRHGTDIQRDEICDIRNSRKRKLDSTPSQVNKRPRLREDSNIANGNNLRDDIVLRINTDKVSVIRRNEQFVKMAETCIGSLTSRLYAAGLNVLEKDQLECKPQTLESDDVLAQRGPPLPRSLPHFSTDDIELGASSCDPDLTEMLHNQPTKLADTLGYIDDTKINLAQHDHPKKRRRKAGALTVIDGANVKVDGSASPDEDEANEEDSDGNSSGIESDPDEEMALEAYRPDNPYPSSKKRRRSFSELLSGISPPCQHLLLLVKHPFKFLHHLPATENVDESWSVDVNSLSQKLRIHAVMQTVTARFGTIGARLVRILHAKGKLDEKSLSTLALMSQKTMRALLTKLSRAGFIEVQEIPKDSQRAPSKTMYLWSFEEERCRKRLLDDTYKAMCRILQRISIEKAKVRDTVEKSERTDVQGHEDTLLSVEERRALAEWASREEMLLGELGRLDDFVAVLRDF